MSPLEFCLYAASGILLGFSLLYLYWRYCFVHYTHKTYSGPRSFWAELIGEGAYPISKDGPEENLLER